jgi:hypothetical protein
MKKRWIDSLKTAVLAAALILLWKSIEWLPWWSFVVPLIGLGCYAGIKQWRIRSFAVGFITGFLIWWLGNLYFFMTGDGIVLGKLGHLVLLPNYFVFLAAGLIGGLPCGIALYVGCHLFLPAKSTTNV